MRLEDWPKRLIKAIEEAESKTFRWGVWDCWLFVADCVEAMTGSDPAEHLRGRYFTEQEADDLLEHMGGVDDVLERLGFAPITNKNFTQRGDIVIFPFTVDGEHKEAAGICVGQYFVCATHEGLTHVAMNHCRKAFRVP